MGIGGENSTEPARVERLPPSTVVLFRALHRMPLIQMVPSDIINSVVHRLVKRCGEAGQAKKPVKNLQALCLGCPVDQIWLPPASFDVISGSIPDVMTYEFYQGALGMAVPEWTRHNLARLRADYQEKILSRSKGVPHIRAAGVWMLTEHRWLWTRMKWRDRGGRSTPPLPESDPFQLTTGNLKKLRNRQGAPKWVRELCKLLPGKVENWEDSYEERSDGDIILEVWRIILAIDKAGKFRLKQKSKEERQRRNRKAQKKQKNKERRRGKREAQKLEAGKKKKRSVVDSSDSSSNSSSDSSESSSSSGVSSKDESVSGTAGKALER